MSSILHKAHDDRAQVDVWRTQQLFRAGYPKELAIAIGEDESIDLHKACDLLAKCGDAELAARILL